MLIGKHLWKQLHNCFCRTFSFFAANITDVANFEMTGSNTENAAASSSRKDAGSSGNAKSKHGLTPLDKQFNVNFVHGVHPPDSQFELVEVSRLEQETSQSMENCGVVCRLLHIKRACAFH